MAGATTQLQRPLLGLVVALAMMVATAPPPLASAHYLSVGFYAYSCPPVLDIVKAGVRSAINKENRMGASLFRLFFHDCFVNGCDGSVLLEDRGSFVGEHTANANNNGSIRGFSVIDSIKAQVDASCGPGVVSCADILAIAARDSVAELGGPFYPIPVGRRDARTASKDDANRDLPAPFEDLSALITKFRRKGFSPRELVALSGGHTVGFAQCFTFRSRIYNETNIDPAFRDARRANCPRAGGQGNSNLAPLDAQSPSHFDNGYFQNLLARRGLLHSDQVLFNGGSTDSVVREYSEDVGSFFTDFGSAMVKMGYLQPLTGSQGEIRNQCSRIN